jgi:hypothetical protein
VLNRLVIADIAMLIAVDEAMLEAMLTGETRENVKR